MKYFPIESPVFGHHHQLDEDFIIKIESEVIIDCTESVLTDSVSNNDDIRATMSLCQTSNQNQFNCLIDNSCSNDDNNSKTDENDIIDYNDNDDIDIKPVIGESTVGRRCSSPTHPAFMRRTSSFESSGYVGSSYTSSETASIKSDTGSSCEKSETESICATNGVNGASSKDSSNGLTDNTPYFCKWTNCDWPGNKDDLVDHIREIHVELQPYQQQKHNWEIKSNGGQLSSSMAIDRKICADSSSNNNKLVNSKKFGDSSNIGSQCKKSESQQYVCLWEGCKVYGKSSLSRNWLERHALLHSGPRPFKCIVEGCDARFKTQSALERHVNSHFKPNVADLSCSNSTNNFFEPSTSTTANGILTPSNYSSGDNSNHCSNGVNGMSPFELHLQQSSHATMIRVKSVNDSNQLMNGSHANANPSFNHSNATPNKILKRKKSQTKLKRKCIIVKCSEDFFDECVMEQVRYGLIQLNAQTGLDMSTQTAITFHSKVIARRKNDESGEINVLLKWEPNDILPDVWVTEPEVSALKSKSIPISLLPQECLAQLTELSGEEIKPKIKQRRK